MTGTSRFDGAVAFSGYQWVILAVAVTAQTSAATSTQAVPVLASFYQEDLRLTSGDVGLFTASFALAMTFTSLAAGWITDRFGVRRSLFLGQMVVGAVALRLRGAYFAIATIGVNEGFRYFLEGARLWGGSKGIIFSGQDEGGPGKRGGLRTVHLLGRCWRFHHRGGRRLRDPLLHQEPHRLRPDGAPGG
ncbi:MAG: hypothetical protein Q8O76_12160 [Chloroflexota bacterium]|nr:hypothetical protein [Chloroflexota bacterium]